MADHVVEASIIVPSYRSERTLYGCLNSLIDQEVRFGFEVVVVDNGSPDGSAAIAAELAQRSQGRLRVVLEPTIGAYAARNRGIHEARGRVLLFTDADCRAEAGWLRTLVAEFEDDRVVLVGGEVIGDPDQDALLARYARHARILSQSHTLRHPRGPFFQTANLAVRRADALAVGGFDESLFSGGDADFCWRIRQRHGMATLRVVPAARVRHVHRDRLRDLFRQYVRYGQSDVVLAQKHGVNLPHTVVKLAGDVLRILCLPVLLLAGAAVAIARRDMLPVAAPFFRCVRVVGRRFGQLLALLRPHKLRRA